MNVLSMMEPRNKLKKMQEEKVEQELRRKGEAFFLTEIFQN